MADDPTPGSSKDGSNEQDIIPRSAPAKLHIIRRLANRLKQKPITYTATKKTYYDLTGLHPDHIQTLSQSKLDDIKIEAIGLDRSIVYKTWVDSIIKNLRLPTTECLFWMLNAKALPMHMDIGDFRTWLLKNGFMWEQCSIGELVVTEKPEVRFERYLYLQNMARYREEDKQIFFIDHAVFDSNGRLVTLKESNKALKNNNESYERISFAVSKASPICLQFICERFTEKTFLDWINQVFLIAVGTPSVIVLTYDKHHCEEIVSVPTLDSTKRDLCKWLDYFNVPYDAEMTKVTLHDLIQKYTDLSEKIYVVDAVLKANGHTVLRIPNCIRKLTPATFYTDMVDMNIRQTFCNNPCVSPKIITSKIIHAVFETCTGYIPWQDIVSEETSILSMDMSVDKLISNIKDAMTNISFAGEGIVDSDVLTDDSDSE